MVPHLKNIYTHRKPRSVYYFRGFSHPVSPWYLWAVPSAAEALCGGYSTRPVQCLSAKDRSVLPELSTLQNRRNVLECSLSSSTRCMKRGHPPFCGVVTKDSIWHPHFSLSRSTGLHRVLVPVSLGSLPGGYTAPARRAPGGPRSLGDQRQLVLISRTRLPANVHRPWRAGAGTRCGAPRKDAEGRARVRAQRVPVG